MDAIQVARACDELHEAIEHDPEKNLDLYATSLGIVWHLKERATWGYPLDLLTRIELLIAQWFSPAIWCDEANKLSCRQRLVELISKLEDGWERPRA